MAQMIFMMCFFILGPMIVVCDWDGQNGGGFSYTRTPANISTGCTNYYADNYDENASIDDGSCIYYDETVVYKEDFGDQSLVENQDRISEDVWLTRSDNGDCLILYPNQIGTR